MERHIVSSQILTVSMDKRNELKSFAYHIIASAILFDRSGALGIWTAFRMLHEIHDCFVVFILFPFCIHIALDRIMVIVATFETTPMAACALAILSIAMQRTVVFYCQCATRCWTPPQQCIVLHKDEVGKFTKQNLQNSIVHLHEAVGYQALIFLSNVFVNDHLHDKIIINNDAAFVDRTLDGFGSPFVCDFQGQVLTPAILTILVIAAQSMKLLFNQKLDS